MGSERSSPFRICDTSRAGIGSVTLHNQSATAQNDAGVSAELVRVYIKSIGERWSRDTKGARLVLEGVIRGGAALMDSRRSSTPCGGHQHGSVANIASAARSDPADSPHRWLRRCLRACKSLSSAGPCAPAALGSCECPCRLPAGESQSCGEECDMSHV